MPRYTTCLAYLHKIPWTSQSSVRIRGEGRVQRTRSKCHKRTAREGDTLVRPGSWETAVVQDEFRDQRGKSVKAEAGGNLNNADCEGYFPADFCWLCVNYIFKRQTDSLPLFPLPPTLPILLIGYCGRSSDRRWWGLSNLRVFSKVATHGRARDTLAAAWILVKLMTDTLVIVGRGICSLSWHYIDIMTGLRRWLQNFAHPLSVKITWPGMCRTDQHR